MLTLQKPRAFWFREAQTAFCRVQRPSEVRWALRRRQFPQELQFPEGLGRWALMCSGTQVPDLHGHHWHLSTREFLRSCLNRCGKSAVLSYAAGWIPFLSCFSYVDSTNSVFSVVWVFCLSAFIHTSKSISLSSFLFLALPCQLSIHRSLTTWMGKNYVLNL